MFCINSKKSEAVEVAAMKYQVVVFIIITSFSLFVQTDVLANEAKEVSYNTEEVNDNIRDENIAPEIVIEVRESVHVNKRKVTLGEIADIEAAPIIKRQLALIDMGFAPAPGKSKIIDGRQVESKIKSNKLFYKNRQNSANWQSSDNIAILVPEKIYVERASQEISEHDLKSIYESYITERLADKDFEIREFSIRGLDSFYPEGEIVISPPISNSGVLKGRVNIYVKVQVNGKDYGRISLSGWVDIFDDVLCTSRSLTRGKVIELSDVHVKRFNIANLSGEYFSSVEDVVGRVLTRNAPSNRAITLNMVEDAALVNKGDRVKIVAARDNLRLVTLGVLKSDGKMGDTVQVQNLTSGKTINAIVTGKESVKVFY